MVDEGPEAAVHGEMCPVSQYLVAPGLLESVHDRENNDDQPHTDCDPADADRGNRRDENLTSLREEVSNRDEPLDRFSHRHKTGDGEGNQSKNNDPRKSGKQQTRNHHPYLSRFRGQHRHDRARRETCGRDPEQSFDGRRPSLRFQRSNAPDESGDGETCAERARRERCVPRTRECEADAAGGHARHQHRESVL